MTDDERVFPAERSGKLEGKARKLLQNPNRILRNYVREGMSVLDVGCGPGFFTLEIARLVGKSGKVIAADLQQEMLDKVSRKIAGTELETRIRLHRTDRDRIGISDHVDMVLAFYLLHEVPDQDAFLKEVESILVPGGRLFLVEPKFKVSAEGFEEEIGKAERAGLKLAERPGISLSRAAVFSKGGSAR
jgi:ubiquinone/menaquinone biosynthesis C-methylase UbiE